MRVELRITSGSRDGQRELFEKSVVTIGRHPMNDFRFHPELDPDVSSRHAELRVVESRVTIHDLNSTNGTFVNGRRVAGERALADGDLIAFGAEGPKVEVHLVSSLAEPAATRFGKASPPGGQAPVGAGAAVPPRRDTTARIAEAVAAQTGKLRTMVIALGVVVVIGVGGTWWWGERATARAQAQIDALLRRNDSLSLTLARTMSSLKGQVAGLDAALAMSKSEGDRLRAQMRAELEKGGNADVETISAQLSAAEGRSRSLLSAASVNYRQIFAQNSPAMVFIAVDFGDGDFVSGSGFNVSPSGLVVTNRHVVQDAQGRAARRVMVAFDNTTAAWKPAHVIKVSPTDELAFIKIDEPGRYAVVLGIQRNAGVEVGAPAAIIGYPLGTGTAGMGGDINKLRPTATLGVATVSKVLEGTLQLDAYAAEGSSGSPIFDQNGLVIGVLYGGAKESGGRIVYAVPSARLAAQMPSEGAGVVR